MTPELFFQWKKKKMDERDAGLAAKRAERAKNDRMRYFLGIFPFRFLTFYYYCLINRAKYVFQRPWTVLVKCQFVCGWWWCWHREIPKGRFWCFWRDGNSCFLMFLLGHQEHVTLFGFAFVSNSCPRVKSETTVIMFVFGINFTKPPLTFNLTHITSQYFMNYL